jgi:hypothetical protein
MDIVGAINLRIRVVISGEARARARATLQDGREED